MHPREIVLYQRQTPSLYLPHFAPVPIRPFIAECVPTANAALKKSNKSIIFRHMFGTHSCPGWPGGSRSHGRKGSIEGGGPCFKLRPANPGRSYGWTKRERGRSWHHGGLPPAPPPHHHPRK